MIDLFDGVEMAEMADVPQPQRSALEVALLRAAPVRRSVDATAVALGLLNAVRTLAARGPVLIAIDDVQWVDPPSAEGLAFAARRLRDARAGFLLTRRPGRAADLERALREVTLERVQLGPLSLGAVRRLLFERLGLTVSRQLLRRVVAVTEGNPLFALEVGRSLIDRGIPSIEEDVPLPETVEELLGTRVARLPSPVRRLLLAVALGCTGWTEQARSELNRIGGRGPRASGELTPSELRVAEVAAQGLANKQIASALFVTVNTVEVHLARAYAKLGVRSRAQLAMRLRLVQ